MMTTIHARPSRTGEASGSEVSSKKRPLDSASGSGLEKKKKDKKKALKRL